MREMAWATFWAIFFANPSGHPAFDQACFCFATVKLAEVGKAFANMEVEIKSTVFVFASVQPPFCGAQFHCWLTKCRLPKC
jgi:hypothetical protein